MLQRESRPRVSGGLETLLQGSWDQAFLSGWAVPGGELRTALCAGEVVLVVKLSRPLPHRSGESLLVLEIAFTGAHRVEWPSQRSVSSW